MIVDMIRMTKPSAMLPLVRLNARPITSVRTNVDVANLVLPTNGDASHIRPRQALNLLDNDATKRLVGFHPIRLRSTPAKQDNKTNDVAHIRTTLPQAGKE